MLTNFLFKGRYATYVQFLNKEWGSESGVGGFKIFSRYIDIYMCSAIFGMLYNKTETYDSEKALEEEKNLSATIRGEMFDKEENKFSFLLRVMVFTSEHLDLSLDDRVDLAFRSDLEDEENKHVLNLLNEYVLGGLSYLYNVFKDARTGEEVSHIMYDLTMKYKKDMEPYLESELKDNE